MRDGQNRAKPANYISRVPTKTSYAALTALVEIANRLSDKGQAPGLAALEQALVRAQELTGTPEALRFKRASRWSLHIPATSLYADARAMLGILRPIVFAVEAKTPWKSPLVIDTQRRLDILSDYSIDLGPELFGETLLRALAAPGCDVRRIHFCAECYNLFVAVPEFKITCSLKCSRLHRVHKFVATNPGYYSRAERRRRTKLRLRKAARATTQKRRVRGKK